MFLTICIWLFNFLSLSCCCCLTCPHVIHLSSVIPASLCIQSLCSQSSLSSVLSISPLCSCFVPAVFPLCSSSIWTWLAWLHALLLTISLSMKYSSLDLPAFVLHLHNRNHVCYSVQLHESRTGMFMVVAVYAPGSLLVFVWGILWIHSMYLLIPRCPWTRRHFRDWLWRPQL